MKEKQKVALRIINGLKKGKKVYLPVELFSEIFDPSKTIRDWEPPNITVEKIDTDFVCICKIDDCQWPTGPDCPCEICLELKSNCKC